MERHEETFELEDVTVKAETDAALLCVIPDVGEEWIPKSTIHDNSEVFEKGTDGKLVVVEWFARRKGWT